MDHQLDCAFRLEQAARELEDFVTLVELHYGNETAGRALIERYQKMIETVRRDASKFRVMWSKAQDRSRRPALTVQVSGSSTGRPLIEVRPPLPRLKG